MRCRPTKLICFAELGGQICNKATNGPIRQRCQLPGEEWNGGSHGEATAAHTRWYFTQWLSPAPKHELNKACCNHATWHLGRDNKRADPATPTSSKMLRVVLCFRACLIWSASQTPVSCHGMRNLATICQSGKTLIILACASICGETVLLLVWAKSFPSLQPLRL